jgi:hypothetical protein
MEKENVAFQLYADDLQFIVSFGSGGILAALERAVDLIKKVELWASDNYLKLNADKTQAVIFGTSNRLKSLPSPLTLQLPSSSIQIQHSGKTLGFYLDSSLSMDTQINYVSKSSFHFLRTIRRVREYLDTGSVKLLVEALVLSRLDYCNSLFASITQSSTDRLQRIQNAAEKVVLKGKKFDHVTPLLYKLDWLPIELRIKKKLMSLMWSALHIRKPSNLAELVHWHEPIRRLRSSEASLAKAELAKTKMGEKAFSRIGPSLWNRLPVLVREESSSRVFDSRLRGILLND